MYRCGRCHAHWFSGSLVALYARTHHCVSRGASADQAGIGVSKDVRMLGTGLGFSSTPPSVGAGIPDGQTRVAAALRLLGPVAMTDQVSRAHPSPIAHCES